MATKSENTALKLGIVGLGTVGVGVIKTLRDNADIIAKRAGRDIAITHVSARSKDRDRGIDLSEFEWVDDAVAMAQAPVDVVVELIGGSDGPALDLAQKALKNGKHFVTANKALIAHHGHALSLAAESAEVNLLFEAAVAGGIPVLKALSDGLAGNQILSVQGILNGTCNYIVSVMDQEGTDFATVLADAQALGYAEADPSFDIDGVDAGHKLAILAAMAFGTRIDFNAISMDGIRNVSLTDLEYARELGYALKLIGEARLAQHGLQQSVSPTLVPLTHPLAQVNDSFNAVVFEAEPVGRVVLEGRGAGEGPTASAVVADVVDIARGRANTAFGMPASALSHAAPVAAGDLTASFYVRMRVKDEVGVAAQIASHVRDAGISMASLLQRGGSSVDGGVIFVLTTHECPLASIERLTETLSSLPVVLAAPVVMRIQAEDDT
jgi:homoserine dehydrogenase